jgi:hypothetical protein
MIVVRMGTQSSAVLRGTHCHLHVGPVPHVSESSPSAVLQRRLIRCVCYLSGRQDQKRKHEV